MVKPPEVLGLSSKQMGTNKIYIFFIGLSLLFWNPVAYYFLYRNTPSFTIQWIFILYSIIFLAAIGMIFLFSRNRIPTKMKNPILSLSILGILFAFIFLINCIIGNKDTKKERLIFEPGTEVRYTSTEFDWLVKINRLGLREKEFDIDKGDKFRILCIGDSWTYGWGVNVQDTYPQQLENYLRTKGKNVEVINGGKAGGYTKIYAQQMKRLIPALKPDLVLVGILQGDDLAQLYEMDSSEIFAWKYSCFIEAKKAGDCSIQLAEISHFSDQWIFSRTAKPVSYVAGYRSKIIQDW